MSLGFELNKEEIDELNKWNNEHKCELKPTKESPFAGATIGGRLTYSFTPNGLGTVIKVKCACGDEIDLTNYDW